MQLIRAQNLNKSELNDVVNLHVNALKESTLNQFGENFLKAIYEVMLKDKDCVFLVIKKDKKIIGYAVATKNTPKMYHKIIKSKFLVLIWEGLKRMIINPKLLPKVLDYFFEKHPKPVSQAELQFIAINSKYQGRGLGTRLISELDRQFRKMGISAYKVGTWASNKQSNSFYKKLKFNFFYPDKILGEEFNFYLSKKLK